VVGDSVGEFAQVVRGLDDSPGVDGFELNVSCPNVKAGGMEFGADAQCLSELVAGARAATERPIFVKLSPTLQDIVSSARVAADAGADGFTLVNTLPGMSIDVHHRRPVLGFGSGGVSGPALLPVGVLATWKVTRAISLPVIGVGGVSRWEDAAQYLLAGASLVGIGTAALRDPRVPQRVVRGILEWCRSEGVDSITNLVGALEWPEQSRDS
jgi:dihydroorotate dehydrogenase (NAD+) catalytic subunit